MQERISPIPTNNHVSISGVSAHAASSKSWLIPTDMGILQVYIPPSSNYPDGPTTQDLMLTHQRCMVKLLCGSAGSPRLLVAKVRRLLGLLALIDHLSMKHH